MSPSPPPPPSLDPLVARTEGLQPWRRILHLGTGLVIVGALVRLDPPWSWAAGALGGLTVLLFLGELVRFSVPALNRLFFRILRPLASPREARGIASSTWYVTGCFLAVTFFPREVAVAAVLILALADPVATYVGQRWGRRPFGTGTVEGSLAFGSLTLLLLAPFAGWGVGALVAAATATVERMPWPLDDNLTIPLVSGLLLWSLLPFIG